MKRARCGAVTPLMIVVLLLPLASQAQWPDDPAVNMVLSNASGSATIPKVAVTSDGGCYVSWWDNTSGNYDMYLQRLDADGTIQWAGNGLLISNQPQDTWLTDYDLAVDSSGCAIIALNDLRAGGDWDIYGYRLSQSGEFLWGPNGLTISDNTGFEPDPRATVTAVGNIVFAWQEEDMIHLRKVSPAGGDLWTPATKTLTSTYGLSIPRITPADSDGVILQLLLKTGSDMYAPKHLYAHKYDDRGTELWGASGVVVTSAGGFGFQMRPEIVTDGAGGAYSYWYDSRNNQLHAYAQHILLNGAMAWTANGVLVSTAAGELQRSADLVQVSGTGDVMLYYEATDLNQNLIGVYGQMLNNLGQRQWGNGGIHFVPMNSQVRMLINVSGQEGGAAITYLECPPGDITRSRVHVIRVDTTGAPVWVPSPVIATTTLSDKGYLQARTNPNGQVIAVWEDKRSDPDGDIYLQNINPDGTFGPYESSAGDNAPNIPDRLDVFQNYPNPFNAYTALRYALPEEAEVTIEIYDILGNRVQALDEGFRQAGHYSLTLDTRGMATGVYFYGVRAGGHLVIKKMLYLK